MKRFLSILLVAILVVTSLATVAFAATEVKTGDVKSFTVTVSGDEFTNYGIQLSADEGLTITGISGAVGNVSNGMVAYAGMTNVTEHSFTVTVQVNATEPGTYNVYASVLQAGKQVTETDDSGNSVFKLVDDSVSANGASFVIPEPAPTEPEPTEPETTAPTVPEPTEPETTAPTEPKPTEPKPTEPKPTEPKPTEPSSDGKDEVADTGDITPYGLFNAMIAVVALAMVSAAVIVFKRKAAK